MSVYHFAEILLPLPVEGTFTYSVPDEFATDISVGMRVIVQFGTKKFYTGIVVNLLNDFIATFEIKEIFALLDEYPVVTQPQLDLWEWIRKYYMCSSGEVMNAALPSGLKIQSETKYQINPDFDEDFSNLNDEEYMIAEGVLTSGSMSLQDIQAVLNKKHVIKTVQSLIAKGVIYPEEECSENFIPKKQTCLRLHSQFADEEELGDALSLLERKAEKQYRAMMLFFQIANGGTHPVPRSEIAKLCGNHTVTALINKNILEQYERVVPRIKPFLGSRSVEMLKLSAEQARAYDEINECFSTKKNCLLYGVTGSGKTEIYIKLIDDYLKQGRQVLLMLPEISLTNYLTHRLKEYFSRQILVYHSRFNMHERVEIWQKMLEYNRQGGKPQLIMGPRSSLFLPFFNPGLIIVDEEHDSSYKQQDPAPRYQGRDLAIVLAQKFDARVLLGSATPSMETWFNAAEGRIGNVVLKERYAGVMPPAIEIVDLRKAGVLNKENGHFSKPLVDEMQLSLAQDRQVILFQNRRGYSAWVECKKCSKIIECRHCDVNLTYHKHIDALKCHYCGYQQKVPKICPSCGSTEMRYRGFGTERIEEDLLKVIPGITIDRLDLETTRRKMAFQQIVNRFESGQTKVLIGTQMISKGLDFSRVNLVSVLNADNLLAFPDFRANEHAFQLLIQVAGRAGRRNERGKVLVQVYNKDNPLLPYLLNNDFESFASNELASRKIYLYPPYFRLIIFQIKHRDQEKAQSFADNLAKRMSGIIRHDRVLGPVAPLISKIRNEYIRQIMVKLARNKELGFNKDSIFYLIKEMKESPEGKGIDVIIDVDPV